MLIVLQATSDGTRAKRIQLRANQVAKVGRSEWADFSFGDDDSMSDVQFEVRSTESGCVVRNLSTESPTFVNGKEIKSITVHDGDQIKAGNTKFVVRIEGERAPAAPPKAEVPAASAGPRAGAAANDEHEAGAGLARRDLHVFGICREMCRRRPQP